MSSFPFPDEFCHDKCMNECLQNISCTWISVHHNANHSIFLQLQVLCCKDGKPYLVSHELLLLASSKIKILTNPFCNGILPIVTAPSCIKRSWMVSRRTIKETTTRGKFKLTSPLAQEKIFWHLGEHAHAKIWDSLSSKKSSTMVKHALVLIPVLGRGL